MEVPAVTSLDVALDGFHAYAPFQIRNGLCVSAEERSDNRFHAAPSGSISDPAASSARGSAARAIVSRWRYQNLRRRPTQVRRSFLLLSAGVERHLTFGSALLVCWSGDATVDVPWPRRFGSFHRSKRGFGSSVTDPRQYVSVTQFYLCQLVRPRSDRHGRPPPCIPIALPAQRAPVCPERLHRCGRCIHATEK